MKRVETAIQQGRCVIVLSGRTARDGSHRGEVRHRESLAWVSLGESPEAPVQALSAEALAPALETQGGVIVLVEPDFTADAAGLNAMSGFIASARNKPRLVVVARAYNPFGMPMAMRLLKTEQEKTRAKDFLAGLPAGGPQVAAAAAAPAPKPQKARAPRLLLVGREDESATLAAALAAGGPIALSGPPGVGKRWLLEHTLASTEGLDRLPDLYFGFGVGFDAVAARIAELSGHEPAKAALRSTERPPPADVIALLVDGLASDALAGKVMVFWNTERWLRRDGSVSRDDRLGMLLKALLTTATKLALVFVTSVSPRFFREGEAAALTHIPVAGLQGRELYDIFETYRAGDVPRDRMGTVHERVHGHPFATRSFAIAWRDSEEDDKDRVFDNKKAFRQKSLGSLDRLRSWLKKQVDALNPELRKALAILAHLPIGFTAQQLNSLGVTRQVRLDLLTHGLADGTPEGSEKRYRAHPLVAACLDRRETSDFGLLGGIAERMAGSSREAEGLERLALAQECNRLFLAARRPRSRVRTGYPDNDGVVDSSRGLLRSRRADIGEMRTNEALKQDPRNPELLVLKAELLAARKADHKEIDALFRQARETCPTPEVYHQQASWRQSRRSTAPMAETILQDACKAFPDNARLKRRLAGLKVSAGRYPDAEVLLREAMDLEPMMPDSYSLFGTVLARKGPEHVEEAEAALREAVSLEPENALHAARLGGLLRRHGLVEPEKREALWGEARELLQAGVKEGSKVADAHLELGLLMLDSSALGNDEDLEQADYLLKKAEKLSQDSLESLIARARVLSRLGKPMEAAKRLKRALAKDASHTVHAALGELYAFQGQIFEAGKEFQQAWELAPADAPEREIYKVELQRINALVESGQALEIVKQAEANGEQLQRVEINEPAGPRRDPGSTTVRRRKNAKKGADDGVVIEPVPASPVDGGAQVVIEPSPDAVAPDASEAAETAPEAAENASEGAETAPEAAETAPEVTETAPEATETAPEATETAPEATEPAAEDVEPAAEDVEPAAEDVEPAAEDVEPAVEDIEPATDDVEPATDDVEPATESSVNTEA